MFTKRNCNHFLVLALAGLFLAIAVVIHQGFDKPVITINKQDSALNLSTDFIYFVSLGNKRLISNLLWIQTLMESDHEKYFKKDYGSWMYLRFLTIAKIDPRFYENYLYGGMYLSVIKDDLLGAADIFERGLSVYPSDYELNYYAGFNYFYEMGEFEKGYNVLKNIEHHPKAPANLKFVINKLRFETTHNYEDTIEFLETTLAITKDEYIRNKIKNDLYSLTTQRDLECLNSKGKSCKTRDPKGLLYLRDSNGKWVSQHNFLPYKIFRSYDKKEEN